MRYLAIDFAGTVEEAKAFAQEHGMRASLVSNTEPVYNKFNGCVTLSVRVKSSEIPKWLKKLHALGWDSGSVLIVKRLTEAYGVKEYRAIQPC